MIIGLTGYKGSGKSEVAKYLSLHYGFTDLSFAAILKRAMNVTFDWPDEYGTDPKLKEVVDPRWGISPRQAYQYYGTEVIREGFPSAFPMFGLLVGSDFWIKRLFADLDPSKDYTISDVRFQNEVDAVSKKGIVAMVTRHSVVPSAPEHASEAVGILKGVTAHIHNEGSLEELGEAVESFASVLRLGRC